MEPLTTTMIGSIVTYIGTKLSNDKSINNFFSEFTEATANWIRPLFLKDDGTEKEAIQKLKEKPKSEARKNAVKSIFEIELEDNPNAKEFIKNMFDQIPKMEGDWGTNNKVINSKNVSIGNNVNTEGGDYKIGDN